MIQHVVHEKADTVDVTLASGLALPLSVAKELHTPAGNPANRTPAGLVAVPQLMGLRMPAARTHRHKVPLRRLTAVAA
ncbi:hypothetical protein [Streptomyces sp. NPDC046985]|uniref:hypothetical protein n=1 Tax=Streptomyces sp. NPDC046985 TaxID=3155377 RepID=UPI00340A3192